MFPVCSSYHPTPSVAPQFNPPAGRDYCEQASRRRSNFISSQPSLHLLSNTSLSRDNLALLPERLSILRTIFLRQHAEHLCNNPVSELHPSHIRALNFSYSFNVRPHSPGNQPSIFEPSALVKTIP